MIWTCISLMSSDIEHLYMWLRQAGALSAAERSYPTSEVRDSSLECQAATVQELQRRATQHPTSGVAAGRRHPRVQGRGRGQEELPRVRGQWRPGGATLRPRSGAAAERSYPASEIRGGQEKPPRA